MWHQHFSAPEPLLHRADGSVGQPQIKLFKQIACCCADPQRTVVNTQSAYVWLRRFEAVRLWLRPFLPWPVYLVAVGKMFPHLYFSAVISPLWVHYSSIKVFSFALNIHSAYSVLSGYYPKPLNPYALCVKPRKLIDMHTTMCIHSPAVFFSSKGEYICSIEKLVAVCIARVLIQNAGLIVKLHRGLKVHYAKCKNWL